MKSCCALHSKSTKSRNYWNLAKENNFPLLDFPSNLSSDGVSPYLAVLVAGFSLHKHMWVFHVIAYIGK